LPGRLQRAASAADRKPSGWEIVIMLAVFPAASVVAALISLSQTLADYSDGSAHAPTIVPNHTILSTVLFVLLVLTDFAPAALAVYFLSLSGGGLRAIGLDLQRPRRDVSRCAKLVLYAYVGPILILGGVLGQFTPHHSLAGADTNLPLPYLIPFVLSALSAGVVEEIVVLGFLCHRLEQRGWNGWQLYAVLIAVRVSYHLYYGTAAIGFAVWGGISVLLYRRRRRLLTFIVAHLIWDTTAFVSEYLHGGAVLLPFLVAIVLLFGLWLTGRAPAVEEMVESGRAQARGETALPVPV
jgi:membrane protease YdiL (CAAX protease family)